MPLSNLRSVLAQVTRGGGRSVIVCRRNLSTRPRPRNLYSSRSIYESGDSYSGLFRTSLFLGANFVAIWETIQMVEYLRTWQRSLEEHAGLESKTPLRNCLREIMPERLREILPRSLR